MSFSPQKFLANINGKNGLARPCRFVVIVPVPTYVNNFVGQSVIDRLSQSTGAVLPDISSFLGGSNPDSQAYSSTAEISRYLSLQCESAELPGRTLLTQESKIYGPIFKVPYQTQYQDMNLTFLCTNEFYERKLFDRWVESIHPSDTNNLRFPKGENSRYMTTIKVIQYDDYVRQIYAVEMIDAFPIGVSAQQLSWSDDGFHRVVVQFAYQKYRVIFQSKLDSNDVSQMNSLLQRN